MKRIITMIALMVSLVGTAIAQNTLNNKADNIIGTYLGTQGEDKFKAQITKQRDDTYQGQIIWLEKDRDATGNKLLDTKNPDKSLRHVPCDQIVIFSGLKYDAKHRRWGDAKIYDPQRGIKVKMTAEFTKDDQLKLRGTVLGIGESVYWKKIK